MNVLGREKLLVLSCDLPSKPPKVLFFARWETTEGFLSQFLTRQPPIVFLTEA